MSTTMPWGSMWTSVWRSWAPNASMNWGWAMMMQSEFIDENEFIDDAESLLMMMQSKYL